MHFGDDVVECFGDFAADFDSLSCLANGSLNLAGGFFGRLGAALRQVAHFFRHHGKPHSGFTGAGGFHRRVERQEVGLKSDFVDAFDDFGNVIAGVFNRGHGQGHGLHIHRALVPGGPRLPGQVGGLLGVLRVALGHAGQFFQRCAGFLQRGRLPAGTHSQILAVAGHLGGTVVEAVRPLFQVVDDPAQRMGDEAPHGQIGNGDEQDRDGQRGQAGNSDVRILDFGGRANPILLRLGQRGGGKAQQSDTAYGARLEFVMALKTFGRDQHGPVDFEGVAGLPGTFGRIVQHLGFDIAGQGFFGRQNFAAAGTGRPALAVVNRILKNPLYVGEGFDQRVELLHIPHADGFLHGGIGCLEDAFRMDLFALFQQPEVVAAEAFQRPGAESLLEHLTAGEGQQQRAKKDQDEFGLKLHCRFLPRVCFCLFGCLCRVIGGDSTGLDRNRMGLLLIMLYISIQNGHGLGPA